MVETPAAVLNAAAIAAQAETGTPRLTCLIVGTNDLAATLEARIRPGRAALVPHLAQVLLAARAYGLAAIDGTFNDIRDDRGLRNECRAARDMGFDGKTLIHPAQVGTANTAFAPSAEDVVWARQVVAAFALPENAGKAVLSVSGRMVERLHVAAAERTLAMADAIAALGRSAG
jgi:citrate lyase subunit beta/citryl-CoA lyase